MKQPKLQNLSVSDLAALFAEIAVEEDKAEKVNDEAKRNRLAFELDALQAELKSRVINGARCCISTITLTCKPGSWPPSTPSPWRRRRRDE